MTKNNRNKESYKLLKEDSRYRKECNLCRESKMKVGKTGYGYIICKVGDKKNGWFATLSPKTGGDPEHDFTIQIMPSCHLTHFSQIGENQRSPSNFGIMFSKISRAMSEYMIENEDLRSDTLEKELSVPLATYAKCTTWSPKKEHLHIKIFQFRGSIGQPYTVDSSFEKKEVLSDDLGKFIKMNPVSKKQIPPKRLDNLAKCLIKSTNKR